MRSRDESKFFQKIHKKFSHRDEVYMYKIPDTIPAPGARFCPQKPYDFFIIVRNNNQNKISMVELKAHKGNNAFPFTKRSEEHTSELQSH